MKYLAILLPLFCSSAVSEVRLINANESEWQPEIHDWGCSITLEHRDHPHDQEVVTSFWFNFVYFRRQVNSSTSFDLNDSRFHLSVYHPDPKDFEYAEISQNNEKVKLKKSQYNPSSYTYIASRKETEILSKIFNSEFPLEISIKYVNKPLINRKVQPKYYDVAKAMYEACIK